MKFELPKAGDEFVSTSDGKIRIVVRIDIAVRHRAADRLQVARCGRVGVGGHLALGIGDRERLAGRVVQGGGGLPGAVRHRGGQV